MRVSDATLAAAAEWGAAALVRDKALGALETALAAHSPLPVCRALMDAHAAAADAATRAWRAYRAALDADPNVNRLASA